MTQTHLCSNQDAILEKGDGDAGASWGPFVQNVGSFFIDTAGQEKLDAVWKDIKVRKNFIHDCLTPAEPGKVQRGTSKASRHECKKALLRPCTRSGEVNAGHLAAFPMSPEEWCLCRA